MCRLFGLHAGRSVVTATFWLLDAPDNLAAQSRRNPDGTGLGVFDRNGDPELRKQPMAAWRDRDFHSEAHEMTGTTFLAHVRYATTGALDVANTHPFLQDGRIFAHNGVVQGLGLLDDRLRSLGVSDLVGGQTDSERVFALITAAVRDRDGDRRRRRLDRRQPAALRAEHPVVHCDRYVGLALSGLPRVVPVGPAPPSPGSRRLPGPAHTPYPRPLPAPESTPFGGVRQRTDG